MLVLALFIGILIATYIYNKADSESGPFKVRSDLQESIIQGYDDDLEQHDLTVYKAKRRSVLSRYQELLFKSL